MTLVLDASMALAWVIHRIDQNEANVAQQALRTVRQSGASVPTLWYSEIANILLVFERAKRLTELDSTRYINDLSLHPIKQDELSFNKIQQRILDLGRRHNLSAYDATYLELAMRLSATLATFDRKLATAARSSGVHVFGDPQ